jgi:oligoendopeptidase F
MKIGSANGLPRRFSVVVAVLGAVLASAQTPFVQGGMSIDLARYSFKSPQEETAARTELNSTIERMQTLAGKLDSSSQLLALLQANDSAQMLFASHDDYLYLRCSLNQKDAACEEEDKLDSEFSAKTAFFKPEILSIPEDRLRAYLDSDPGLQRYRYELSDIRRDAAHLLPAEQERFLDELRPEISGWQYDLYREIFGGIDFGSVQTPTGPLDVIRQRNLIASNIDPRVREEGFHKRYLGYARQRDLLAFALLHTVQAQQAIAKEHGFPDAPARKYVSLDLDPATTRDLLNLMAQHGEIPKRYETLRLRELENAYSEPAHVWDLSAPNPKLNLPITPLPETRSIFHEAFAGLGKEYQAAFDSLIDGRQGRADILPGGAANRYTSGFSLPLNGTSVLFYGRYDGTFKDLSVIAHEGGHAVHRQLMADNHVLPCYRQGPHLLFESFAEFNELLLAEYMAEHASSPELRSYYRERWMGIKGLDAFYAAQDAQLEQDIYDGVSAATVRTADDLEKLTVKIDSQFSQFPSSVPELRNRWMLVSLMFEDPLYDVNYVYAGLLALKYYQLYSTRRDWFVPRYVGLLKNGFDKTPAELLRQFLEIDLSDSSLLTDDLNLLNHRLDEMEVADQKPSH